MDSMTGFGRGSVETPLGSVVIEAKSVNGRGLDVKVRGRDVPASWEAALTRQVRERFRRGSVTVQVVLERSGGEADGTGLLALRAAQRALERLRGELGLAGPVDLGAVAAAASLFSASESPLHTLEFAVVTPALAAALDGCAEMRAHEGRALADDLRARCQRLVALTDELASRSGGQNDRIAARLRDRMQALLTPTGAALEPGRLEQEIALLCDRADVTEELVRLRTHLGQMQALLTAKGPAPEIGRKLEFWTQEVGRELHTLSVKMQDSEASALVVEAKAELEKIREQAQNIE